MEFFLHNLTLTEGGEEDFMVTVEDDDHMESLRYAARHGGHQLPSADVSSIKSLVAMNSLREEGAGPDDDDLQEFESEIERDYLMQLYHQGNGSADWLCRHLGLPAQLAKHIHDFVVWKPCPVLCFHPGDLVLSVTYFDTAGEEGECGQYYVARKVSI